VAATEKQTVIPHAGSPNVPRDKLTVPCAPVDLRPGAWVIYGGHGLGRVSRTRDDGGKDGSSVGRVVVEFASSGLSVTLPLDRAVVCLRSVANEGQLTRVRDALRSGGASIETSWQARTKRTRAKLSAGEAVGLAEIIHDGFARQCSSATGGLSMHERELYLKARRLLAAELGAATATDEAQADAWIDGQLTASRIGSDEHLSG
jgi:RNA polymerase-interacting CarD/CdnL/TRCF family regulator